MPEFLQDLLEYAWVVVVFGLLVWIQRKLFTR
jgi:hypothetical protein